MDFYIFGECHQADSVARVFYFVGLLVVKLRALVDHGHRIITTVHKRLKDLLKTYMDLFIDSTFRNFGSFYIFIYQKYEVFIPMFERIEHFLKLQNHFASVDPDIVHRILTK